MGLVFLKTTQGNIPCNVLNFSCNCCCEICHENEISQIMHRMLRENIKQLSCNRATHFKYPKIYKIIGVTSNLLLNQCNLLYVLEIITIPGINNKHTAGYESYLIYFPLHPNYKIQKDFHYIYIIYMHYCYYSYYHFRWDKNTVLGAVYNRINACI